MERFSNFATTTLSAGIDASQTSVGVDDGAVFPSTGDFSIIIGSEIMKVTARSTNTLTVVRAQEGTTGASHSSGAAVDHVITARTMDGLRVNNFDGGAYASLPTAEKEGRLYIPTDGASIYRDDGADWSAFGPMHRQYKPVNGDFSWVNQGGATIADTNVGLFLEAPAGAGTNMRIRTKSAPSTPYTVRANILPAFHDSNFNMCGIGFRESATSKLESIHFIRSTTALIEVNKWTNPTTYNSTRTARNLVNFWPYPRWLGISNDGTDIGFHYSNDGLYWFTAVTVAKNNFFTTAPDQVFFFASTSNATWKVILMLTSWQEL